MPRNCTYLFPFSRECPKMFFRHVYMCFPHFICVTVPLDLVYFMQDHLWSLQVLPVVKVMLQLQSSGKIQYEVTVENGFPDLSQDRKKQHLAICLRTWSEMLIFDNKSVIWFSFILGHLRTSLEVVPQKSSFISKKMQWRKKCPEMC